MQKHLLILSPRETDFAFLKSALPALTPESAFSAHALIAEDLVPSILALARHNGCDAAVFASRPRWQDYKVLMMDMDCTSIENETLDEMADLAGLGAAVKAVTDRAMLGQIDFQESLRARMALFAGLPQTLFTEVIEKRLRVRAGLLHWLNACHAQGLSAHLVSGGFTPVVEHFVRTLGFDSGAANNAAVKAGLFTGELTGEIVDADFKANYTLRCAAQRLAMPGQVIAIGDGANDSKMLRLAGLAIGMQPKPILAEHCDICLYHTDYRHLPLLFTP